MAGGVVEMDYAMRCKTAIARCNTNPGEYSS
jgi:hypothetical protein